MLYMHALTRAVCATERDVDYPGYPDAGGHTLPGGDDGRGVATRQLRARLPDALHAQVPALLRDGALQ